MRLRAQHRRLPAGLGLLGPEARPTLGPWGHHLPPSWGRLLSKGWLWGLLDTLPAPATSASLCPWAVWLPAGGRLARTAPGVRDSPGGGTRTCQLGKADAPHPWECAQDAGEEELSGVRVLAGRLAVFGEPQAAPPSVGAAGAPSAWSCSYQIAF